MNIKLYDLILKNEYPIESIDERQYLLDYLNILTTTLINTITVQPHRNSRLSKCKCVLCRYSTLLSIITQSDFPEELSLPRKTPNYTLKFLPQSIKSLNISQTLINKFIFSQRTIPLISLNISSTQLAITCMNEIKTLFPSLKILHINDCKVTNTMIQELKDMQLDELYCCNNFLNGNVLSTLSQSPLASSLKYLDISNNSINKSSLSSLSEYPSLRIIILKGTEIDQRTLKSFVSRHSRYKYNGMTLEKTPKKYTQQTFTSVNQEWGVDKLTETLCTLGCVYFKQEQTNAKTSTDAILFMK